MLLQNSNLNQLGPLAEKKPPTKQQQHFSRFTWECSVSDEGAVAAGAHTR